MNLEDLRNLYAYDEWANERILLCAAELTEEQQKQNVVSSFPSVAATIAHVVGAEWVWLKRLQGASPARPEEWTTYPSLPQLRERLSEIEGERRDFLATFDESRLGDLFEYRNLSGEAKRGRYCDLMLHVVNHSTYHRGQLTTMLRQLGAVPPATDLMLFNAEQ
jgi:uncharacterized damage-inducible protein DinB